MAKYIWQLKCSNINFSSKNSIASKKLENPSSIICQLLCLTEKLWIITFFTNNDLLNKKSEVIDLCEHLNKLF